MNDNEQLEQGPYLSLSPSFGEHDRRPISAAADPHHSGDDESDGGDEFEFSIGFPSPADGDPADGDPADEIFANGRILPVYPVFNRSLISPSSDPNPDPRGLRSGSASSTSSADSLDVSAGAFCAWAPRSVPHSPDLMAAACKKSSSTGDESKRWKIRDLVGGRRSHSDGKEKLVNFKSGTSSGTPNPNPHPPNPNPNPNPNPKLGKGEMDLVTAHRLFYGKDKGGEKGSGKRSFLPYKPELVGLFANSRAHHHHPFNF